MESKKKSRRIAALFGGLALALAAGGAQADSSGKWTSGKEVYDKVCGYCHELKTSIGPDIRGKNANDIRERVRKGHRAMPAFRQSEIDDQALALLIDYLK